MAVLSSISEHVAAFTDDLKAAFAFLLFFYRMNFQTDSTVGLLQKMCRVSRHFCQPLGISVRAPRCGTLTHSSLWNNKMPRRASQTCRICLILNS